jgi:hypothetical protein
MDEPCGPDPAPANIATTMPADVVVLLRGALYAELGVRARTRRVRCRRATRAQDGPPC